MEYTAESVTPKHPDKICDRISDAILDDYLKKDINSRVAVETMGGHGVITITGEVTSSLEVGIRKIVSRIAGDLETKINISKQSLEISRAVDLGGVGDQGVMIGYACNENEQQVPQEFYLARKLCRKIYEKYPVDGKTQVTMKNNKIKSVIASFQGVANEDIAKITTELLKVNNKKIHANPAGVWFSGGFESDTGLTGRKIVVDNYGPRVPVGGGAFSGKDPTKIDRSGAYMARKIAKEILKKENANEVLVQIAYSIGKPEPESAISVIDGRFKEINKKRFRLSNIIKELNLMDSIYEKTAEWGAFGFNFNWDS
jgi:S-adenosylmethionine synthetase